MTNEENTSDRENKKHVAYSTEVNQIRPILVKYFNEYSADLLADLSDLLTSRDTYWKERVLAIIEEHDPSSGRETNPRYWGKTLREAIKSIR